MTEIRTFFKQPRRKTSSKSRATQRRDRAYTSWREGQLGSRPWCEARRRGVCTGRAVVLHHRRLVRQGGAKLSAANTMAVCNSCHVWIHHNVSQARLLGWLVSSRDDEYGELGEHRVASWPNLFFLVFVGAAFVAVAGVIGLLALLVLFLWLEGGAW